MSVAEEENLHEYGCHVMRSCETCNCHFQVLPRGEGMAHEATTPSFSRENQEVTLQGSPQKKRVHFNSFMPLMPWAVDIPLEETSPYYVTRADPDEAVIHHHHPWCKTWGRCPPQLCAFSYTLCMRIPFEFFSTDTHSAYVVFSHLARVGLDVPFISLVAQS